MSKPLDRTTPAATVAPKAPGDVIKKAREATGPRAARGDDDVMSQRPAAPRTNGAAPISDDHPEES